MTNPYDPNNIFAKMLRGEIAPKIIYEDEHVLAFHDIQAQRKIHALVIPKGAYQNASDFGHNASEAEIVALSRSLPIIAGILGLANGYRVLTNCGKDGGQEVPHYHLHMLGGEKIGPMVA